MLQSAPHTIRQPCCVAGTHAPRSSRLACARVGDGELFHREVHAELAYERFEIAPVLVTGAPASGSLLHPHEPLHGGPEPGRVGAHAPELGGVAVPERGLRVGDVHVAPADRFENAPVASVHELSQHGMALGGHVWIAGPERDGQASATEARMPAVEVSAPGAPHEALRGPLTPSGAHRAALFSVSGGTVLQTRA